MELGALDVWLIVAGALVLLMTPGLAFFYGGLTQAKASVNMMMMSFSAMGLVAIVWALWGASVAEGDSIGGVFGDPLTDFGLYRTLVEDPGALIGIGFGATFAVITVALISGAVADRAKFSAWMVFVPVWVTLVYCPLAFMVWGDGGLLVEGGAIGDALGEAVDYAGGLVVHMCAGLAALVLALILGKRGTFDRRELHRPHNTPFVLLGCSLLWFGWFGFNTGAAEEAGEAGLIWVNTLLAPAAGLVAWLLTQRLRGVRPNALGAASGIVAGLVAITPACAFVDPVSAIVIGGVAGAVCCLAVELKYRLGFDDTLDVVGLHFVAGLWGTLAIGLVGRAELIDGERSGLLLGGGTELMVAQLVACAVTLGFTVVMTLVIGAAIHAAIGFRIPPEEEARGIDAAQHDESAYVFDDLLSAAVPRGGDSDEQARARTELTPHPAGTGPA
ncbi:MAG: ammonium transporter [Nesterenkonia sp.]|uniref:ammonium transporter n=1 Tax=Nesterenkonia marinintestina TaxID=2979865 RepID=UPI0021C0F3DD|nr:ammonium transporter [Nesterenkonia sp. GX14115]MDO5492039.1 ammonium transporter [Nesterenkonia sp.]